MNIHLIAPALPPSFDAIGDYTALLSRELARCARVKVLLPHGPAPEPIPGVTTEQVFDRARRASVRGITRQVTADRPDWVVLQFNQFSYGKWGLNPWLPLTMRAIQRRCKQTKFALMLHENFVPSRNWKSAMMRVWQRWQFKALVKTSDVAFCSIQPWIDRYQPWFPDKTLLHLPVGANIPRVPITKEEARKRLNLPEGSCVLGIFGTFRDASMMDLMRGAAEEVKRAGHDIHLLYIGPHGAEVRKSLGDLPLLAEGPLPAEEVSRRFSAMDVYFAPYIDGVSTRRGALMAGLQHGIATVGTRGHQTDRILADHDCRAFMLAPVDMPKEFFAHTVELAANPRLRADIGEAAQRLYDQEFAWERVASRLMAALQGCGSTVSEDIVVAAN